MLLLWEVLTDGTGCPSSAATTACGRLYSALIFAAFNNGGISLDLLTKEDGKLRRRAANDADQMHLREPGAHGGIAQRHGKVVVNPLDNRRIGPGGREQPVQTVMLTALRSGLPARLGRSGVSGERSRSLVPKILTEPSR